MKLRQWLQYVSQDTVVKVVDLTVFVPFDAKSVEEHNHDDTFTGYALDLDVQRVYVDSTGTTPVLVVECK